MRTLSELTEDQRTQAKSSADKLLSQHYRSYLPDRKLPLFLARYRDDVAEALGMKPPALPSRAGQIRQVTLDELTTPELYEITHVVLVLLTYADTMDDPALPVLLREFRESLVRQKGERTQIEQDFAVKAKAAS